MSLVLIERETLAPAESALLGALFFGSPIVPLCNANVVIATIKIAPWPEASITSKRGFRTGDDIYLFSGEAARRVNVYSLLLIWAKRRSRRRPRHGPDLGVVPRFKMLLGLYRRVWLRMY